MNKFLAAIGIVCLLSFAEVTYLTGCGTPGSSAHKAEVITLPSVNVAMEQWAAYVKAGKATQGQVDTVKATYSDYYSSQLAAHTAETAWVNSKSAADQTTFVTAATTASAKGAAVVALVTTYMTVK